MATPEVKKVSRTKAKKKAWYPLLAPALFGNKEMGEAYLENPEAAVGRVMRYNLKELTGNVKDQNAYLFFRLEKVVGNTLHTKVIGYELTPVFVRRIVRKDTDRIDGYHVVATKNGEKVVLKTVMITLQQTQRSLQTKLRQQLQEFFQEEAAKHDFNGLIEEIVSNKVRTAALKKLCKIYPVREVAIRAVMPQKVRTEATTAPPASL